MHHLSDAQLLIDAFVLILAIVIAVSAFLDNRRAKVTRARDYFGPVGGLNSESYLALLYLVLMVHHDRDLLQHSSLSETEDWVADRHARFAPLRLRDPGANERR